MSHVIAKKCNCTNSCRELEVDEKKDFSNMKIGLKVYGGGGTIPSGI